MNLCARAFHGLGLLALAFMAQADPFAYVVNSDSPATQDFDSLYRVNLANGDATLIGPTGYADVEGLAFSPDGVLYGVDDATETLIILDAGTGDGSPVNNTPGNLGLPIGPSYDFGLSFDLQGNLFLSSDTSGDIWSVNPATGEATLIHNGSGQAGTGTDGTKSAADPGTLSGLAACNTRLNGVGVTGDEQLYRVPDNGAPELVGPLQAGLQFTDAGLDYAADGTLWGIADRSTDINGAPLGEPSRIFTIDSDTGAASRQAQTLVGVESLAIGPPPASCDAQAAGAPSIPALSWPGLTALLFLFLTLGTLALCQPRSASRR